MSEMFINDYIQKIISLEKCLGANVGYQNLEPTSVSGSGLLDIVKLQNIAKEIADFIGLNNHTFVVSIAKQKQSTAGKIELAYSGTNVFVEVDGDMRDFGDAMVATIAHELTHKYMQINSISSAVNLEYENEVFTDITAIFLGLGKLLLNGSNNKQSYQEFRSGEKYEVTRTLNVGYLTPKQIAFVYRLICSMRKITKKEMLRNLNSNAKIALSECDSYEQDYFNLNFHCGDYRKKVAEIPLIPLCRLESNVDEIGNDLIILDSKIQKVKKIVGNIEQQIIAIKEFSEQGINNLTYDPCMNFLECLRVKQWGKQTKTTLLQWLKETRKIHKSTKCLKRLSQKKIKITKNIS